MKNYDDTYKAFKWDVPEFYNFATDVVDRWADNRTKLALLSVDDSGKNAHKHTFWELSKASMKFANLLSDNGIGKGDRVFIMLPRIPEWYTAVLGCIRLGAIFMPTPTLSTPKDIKYRIDSAGAAMAITSVDYADRINEVSADCASLKSRVLVGGEKEGWVNWGRGMEDAKRVFEPPQKTRSDDPMLVYFTSGTTGYPKMVMHTQAYAIGHIVTARFVQDLRDTDMHWTIADTGWAKTAWGKLFGQWIQGSAVVQWNMTGRFNPRTVLNIIQDYGITTFCAPPTAYRMLILEDLKTWDLSTLRHCLSAGEPLNPDVIRAWKEGVNDLDIYDYYGQTESVCLIGNYRCKPIKAGSMGLPTPGHLIDIIDDDGNMLPAGEEGHIGVRTIPSHPPGLFKGYWKNEDASADSFRNGWYYTGDKAYKDADGYFWFVGRADDVIKSSGYRIGPFEVESALQEHPAVAESAVIGVPDEMRGQAVKAFVILAPGHKGTPELTKELQEYVRNLTAPYKYPRDIEYVTELPKTISGKIRRVELRANELKKQGK